MSKVKILFDRFFENLETIFYFLLIFLINIEFIFTILKKNSIASLCFKSSFIIVSLFLIFLVAKKIIKVKKIKEFFKTDLFKNILIIFIIVLSAGILVFIPFFIKTGFSFDYTVKYLCLVFVFIYITLLNDIKPKKEVIRFNVYLSAFVGILFCLATAVPSLRNRTYTGAFTYNFPNPNTAALVLCFIFANLIYGFFVAHSAILKTGLIVEAISILVLIYFTQARAPFVAILISLICSFLIFKTKEKNHFVVTTYLILFILFFSCSYILITYYLSGGKAADLVEIPGFGKGITTRYGIWVEGMKRITEKPLTGFYAYFNGSLQYHNAILDLFVSYGILVGLIITICFVYLLSKSFKKFNFVDKSQYAAFFALFTCLFTGLFESSIFSSPQGLYILFFSFIVNINCPITSDCLSENNAFNFDIKTNNTFDVLLINSVYKKGSTGKIIDSLKCGIERDGHTVAVLYGRKKIEEPVINAALCSSQLESLLCRFINKFTKDSSLFNYFSTYEYIRIIHKYKPQVVHIHCLNDYYINQYLLFKYLKKHHIKTVLTLHSENLYVGCQEGHVFDCKNWQNGNECKNCSLHKNSKSNAATWVRLKKMFTDFPELEISAVSPWLSNRAKKSTILKSYNIKTILNGVDDVFSYHQENSDLLPDSFKLKKKILFVCANVNNLIKGYKYFKFLANKFKGNDKYKFICLSLEKYSNEMDNIYYLDPIKSNEKLAKLYSECDLSLVLSQRETFSMPTAESLCCGTRVVGFECGGAESISPDHYTKFVEYGNEELLSNAVEDFLRDNIDKQNISKFCKDLYSCSKMVISFNKLYNIKNKSEIFEIRI